LPNQSARAQKLSNGRREVKGRNPINGEQVEQMMRELGRTVWRAMSASEEVTSAIKRLEEKGFTLNLMLDCKHAGAPLAQLEIEASGVPALEPGKVNAQFRLESQDVNWLRSLGIDATRPGRRQRRREP
jgi:hypothetical protein